MRSVLVAGGTGLVGGHLLQQLSDASESLKIKALVRKGRKLDLPGVNTLEVDYDNLQSATDQLEADVAFCCLGTTIKKAGSKAAFRKVDLEYPIILAKNLFKHNCQHFHMITAAGADVNSLFFYNQVKGEVEKELMQVGFESLSIYRPSLLLGERKEHRTGESIAAVASALVNPLLIGPFRKFRAIRAEVVAKAMFRHAFSDPAGLHIFESNKIQEIGEQA